MDDKEYSYLKGRILKSTNIDLGGYNSQQMRRRLEGFITRYNLPSVVAYCRMIEQDQKKLRELLDFLTINVSEFFRDSSQFQCLKTLVLPKLLERSPRLNIWSAACSCGQEPYSIAMTLEDLYPGQGHRILATDIDASALERARKGGPYPPGEVKNVEDRLIRRFFQKTEEGYWVTEDIKRRVRFGQHNLLGDPAEKGFDLVVCRNVVIYFSDVVRNKLHQKLWDCLKVEGVLFIGGSEVLLRPRELGFASLYASFYRKVTANVEATLVSRA